MISRFFSWWFGELSSLLPSMGGGSSATRGRVLTITAGEDNIQVGVEGARGRPRLVAPGDNNRLREAVQELSASLDPSRTRVQVRIPHSQALVTFPSLPMAAEENLREVLGFEMDRLTPFRSSDVYYAYQVKSRDRVSQQIQVALQVVRRNVVDPLIAGLGNWSLSPASSTLAADNPMGDDVVCLDFTPARFRERSSNVLNAALALVVVALAAVAVYLPVKSQQDYRVALDKSLQEARADAAAALKVREELDLESKAAQILSSAKGARPSTVEILETVSRLLPDHTYLFRFELRGEELSVQGSSEAASSLIALLDASEWLTNVRFVSPVTRDARSGGERFHISAQLVSPDAVARRAARSGVAAGQDS